MSRTDLNTWKALAKNQKAITQNSIHNLFKRNPDRFDQLHCTHDGILLDYSKQYIDPDIRDQLIALAHDCDLEQWRDDMFAGKHINTTEDRAVLHTALRQQNDTPIIVNGENIIPKINDTFARMKHFSDKIRQEKRFTHIVNIGIGGSDLGTAMAYKALQPFTDRDLHMHFVSNVDSADLMEALQDATPENTLFIVTSKSFTTLETMMNACTARQWLKEKLGSDYDIADHFVAATENVNEALSFGLKKDAIFPMWDWVGGRYSVWSSVGLPLCIALGYTQFKQMHAGAHSMDTHFKTTPLAQNMPVLLALMGVWNVNFMGYDTLSLAPYNAYLTNLPKWMQQVDMESNGKSVDKKGNRLDYDTGPVIFGKTGTNGQHAFFQMMHQGTTIVPTDFIITLKSQNPKGDHQKALVSNAIAQSKAFMIGQDHDNPHRVFTGNRVNNTIILDELTPYSLGMLMALYEHKIFVQGIIWNINSFDQFGVELGKVLAKKVVKMMDSDNENNTAETDGSTHGLINYMNGRKI